jgi:hypothetical protein
MANLKSGNNRNIQLENVQAEFSTTKTYPADLVMPEVQKAWCYVFDNGTAELSFKVRTDMEPTTGAMNKPFENAPGFHVETEISREQLLDCVSHANVYDVVGGGVWAEMAEHGQRVDLSEDFVRDSINDEAAAIVRSYICLFGSAAIAQARAEHEANAEVKSFKPALESVLGELQRAA